MANTDGPFEYYNEIHSGVDGDSIRSAAQHPGTNAGVIQALAGELEGDEKKTAGAIEGAIEDGTTANPKAAKGTAQDLAAKGTYAVGLLNLFASYVDTFDKTVDGLNTKYHTLLNQAYYVAHHTDPDIASGKTTFDWALNGKSVEAQLRPQYNSALTKLDTDADTIATKFSQGPKPENVRELIRAGLIPLEAASLYPGLKLTSDDKRSYYKSMFAQMTTAEQVAWVKAHKDKVDPLWVSAVPPDAQNAIATEVAGDIKSKNIDADTVKMLQIFATQHPFAHSLYSQVSPNEMSDAIKALSDGAYGKASTGIQSHAGAPTPADKDAINLYHDFLVAAGTTLATYSTGTGAYAPPADAGTNWGKAICDDDHPSNASALGLLLREGGHRAEFGGKFLSDVADTVYNYEKDHQDDSPWGSRKDDAVFDPCPWGDKKGVDYETYGRSTTDAMALVLGSMEKSPDAAQMFFDDDHGHVDHDKLNYLLVDRTFSASRGSDEGDGLGMALEAATVGGDHTHTQFSADLASQTFKLIADHSGTGDGFGPDDVWHAWPQMTDSLGNIAAGYSDDVYDLVAGAPHEGAGHLAISMGDFDKVLGEMGRGDKSGVETLSAAVMIEGNDRFHDTIEQWRSEHPGVPLTMDALSRSGLGPALEGIGGRNGEVLGHILNKSVLVDLKDEDLAKTRAAYISKAVDIAGGFIPGAGSVLGEGASDLAKASFDVGKGQGLDLLKQAVAGTPPATATDYVRDQRSTVSDALEYNITNQLIRSGYLGDQHPGDHDPHADHASPIPPSLLVNGPNGSKVLNPDLYDADGVDTIGKKGEYTDAQVKQMKADWYTWFNSIENKQADAVTGAAQDGFDREVNKGG